jgi:teichuronic acid biosynthesis glycosyltransferase TuaH
MFRLYDPAFSQSIYPLKINEYLAAGLPVISVNFSYDIESFHHVAYIEDTHEGFLQAIRVAIKENTPERVRERLNVASQNSWTARVAKFWEILGQEAVTGGPQVASKELKQSHAG